MDSRIAAQHVFVSSSSLQFLPSSTISTENMAKAYMGKTGIVLFSVALAIFALLNAISTFTRYGQCATLLEAFRIHRSPVVRGRAG